jgi:hypothetical protein
MYQIQNRIPYSSNFLAPSTMYNTGLLNTKETLRRYQQGLTSMSVSNLNKPCQYECSHCNIYFSPVVEYEVPVALCAISDYNKATI